MYNGEILVSFIYRGIYFAVVQRRDFSLFYIQRHLPRRCTTARFQSLLYTEAFTSPLYNGEILVSFIYRGIYFAVVQRRDFGLFYIQRHLLRRCTTARFQSLLYTEAFTSPLYNGEILVSFIYRGIYFAVVQRQDFGLFYVLRHLPRRCTTARFWSLLCTEVFTSPLYNGDILVSIYTEAFTSPLYNGEILVSFIYRGIYFAVAQRRDFTLLYTQRHLPRRCTTARFQSLHIQRHLLRRCTTARFWSLLYTEAFTSPLYNGEILVSFIYRDI